MSTKVVYFSCSFRVCAAPKKCNSTPCKTLRIVLYCYALPVLAADVESCPSGRRCSTRKLRCTLEVRNPASLEITGHPVWNRYRIPVFSLLLFSPVSSRKSERFVEEYIHGELSEWSKVQHSKCCEESNPPRVQIPDSPPQSSAEAFCRALFALVFR